TLWLTGDLLVGSKQPIRLDQAALAAKFASPRTRAALDDVGLDDAQQVLDWYHAGTAELRRRGRRPDHHRRLPLRRVLPLAAQGWAAQPRQLQPQRAGSAALARHLLAPRLPASRALLRALPSLC